MRFGQETEFFIKHIDQDAISNAALYHHFISCIGKLTKKLPARSQKEQVFIENGGAIGYEAYPQDYISGLMETATPECERVEELILYQRAIESLLRKASKGVKDRLTLIGHSSNIKLLKNSRDTDGKTYGCQENYEVDIARGWRLKLFRLLLALLFPLVLSVSVILLFSQLIALFVGIFYFSIVFLAFLFFKISSLVSQVTISRFLKETNGLSHTSLKKREEQFLAVFSEDLAFKHLVLIGHVISFPLTLILFHPLMIVYRLFAFKQHRQHLTSFLISRPVISGSGSLIDNDTFIISERADAINAMMRYSVRVFHKPMFDSGNLAKDYNQAVTECLTLNFGRLRKLFQEQQRLQISYSDANRCPVSEYLKIGTTKLVLEAIEDGFIRQSPTFKEPLKALKIFAKDPSLKVTIKDGDGIDQSMLSLQKFYLQQIKEWMKNRPRTALEDKRIVDLWQEYLDFVEFDREGLIGRSDWVTKKYLIETSGKNLSHDQRKTIDLSYHDLNEGPFVTLQESGIILNIHSDEEIEKAETNPPDSDRVKIRSAAIKRLAYQGSPAKISWDNIYEKSAYGKIIDLFRKT